MVKLKKVAEDKTMFRLGLVVSRSFTATASSSVSCVPVTVTSLQSLVSSKRWSSNVKMTKQLKRMFDKKAGVKKKKFFSGPINLGTMGEDVNPRKKRQYSEGQKRRAQQMGTVLYNNITRLVNSGEVSEQLSHLSVEIVRVKVLPDFSAANVYWLSSGTKEDDIVQTLFNENAGRLRQLLTSFHVLGNIPRINFVRDNSHARYLEVEALLKTADFGPDFIPTPLHTSIRDNITLKNHEDSISENEQLQAQFSALDFTHTQDNIDSSQKTLKISENLASEVNTELMCETRNETAKQETLQSETLNKSSLGSKTVSFGERSETMQKSSLQADHLHDQYFPAFHDTDTEQESRRKGVESLSKSFRHDLYKVPHSELLNKLMMRKKKAGLRPSVQDQTKDTNSVVYQEVAALKPLLQKKWKPKGRLRNSDYLCRTDPTQFNSADNTDDYDYVNEDDHGDDDEEIYMQELEHNFSATDDQPDTHRKQ